MMQCFLLGMFGFLRFFFYWEFVWESKIKGNVLSLLRQFVCLPCCPIRLFSVCNVTWKYKQKVLFGIKLEWMKQLHKNLNSHLLGSLSKNNCFHFILYWPESCDWFSLVTTKTSFPLCFFYYYTCIYLCLGNLALNKIKKFNY